MSPPPCALRCVTLLPAGAMLLAGCSVLFSPGEEGGDDPPVPACTSPLWSGELGGEEGICAAPPLSTTSVDWDGTFSLSQTIDGQGSPCRMAVGDFDGDEDLDLVVAVRDPVEPPEKNFLIWDELDDRFVAREVAWERRRVISADVGCDGELDLIGTSGGCGGGRLNVERNGGSGRFSSATYDSICNARAVAFGDLDGDGSTEVLVGGGERQLRVHAGPDLGRSCMLDVGPLYPDDVSVADFDGDGDLDLVVSDHDELAYARGDGDGGFEELDDLDGVSRALVSDVDNDGIDDLVVARADEIVVYLGGPGFPLDPPRITVSENRPTALAAADFDGDGHLDLLTAGGGEDAGRGLVLLGDGSGAFGPDPVFSMDVGSDPREVVTGDWNGDGVLDLGVCSERDGTLSVLLGGSSLAGL